MRLRRSLLLVGSLALGACASDTASGTERGGSGSSSTAAGGSSGTLAGAGGTGDFGNTSNTVAMPPPQVVELPGDDGNCGATSVQAEQVVVEEMFEVEEEVTTVEPVAFYIIMDQSFSMVPLWPGAVGGVTAFVTDPMSDGIDVAMDFFPGFGAIRGCDGSGYENPLIPMGRLPAHASTVTSALANMPLPTGIGTPIEGGLRGGAAYCANFQQQNPGEKCIVVFVTDGAPSGCDENLNNLIAIAANAFTTQDVVTYGVGLTGSNFTLLNSISMQSGADDCDPGANYACDVTAGADQLVLALNRIREAVTMTVTRIETVTMTIETPLECEWELPAPDSAAQGFDADQVNVQLTAPSIADRTLGKVASAADCVPDAWHYDDPLAPTRIVACPETCDSIQATTGAAVDILLGCPTVVIE